MNLRTHAKRTVRISILLALLSLSVAMAAQTISYQGRLTDQNGQPVSDGQHTLQFALYADSTGGSAIWSETAAVQVSEGFFTCLLGQGMPFPPALFSDNAQLFLEVVFQGVSLAPRQRLTNTPYAMVAHGLAMRDSNGTQSISTDSETHNLTVHDSTGAPYIQLQDMPGDNAVVLPGGSINADEIVDEPGIAVSTEIDLIPLVTTQMTDLVTVTVEIPTSGYIVLHGKCYVLLSGTTGANAAIVQIDENEGGGTQFPYYTVAGLGGYVNSSTNYFPVYVTRAYFKSKGTCTFRLEGRAQHTLPAVAKTWDHVLTAVFYPTTYYGVEAVVADPTGYQNVTPVTVDSSDGIREPGTYYKVNLKERQESETQDQKK